MVGTLRFAHPTNRAAFHDDGRSRKIYLMDASSPKDLHYYEPANGHGLRHDPFNAIIAPRGKAASKTG